MPQARGLASNYFMTFGILFIYLLALRPHNNTYIPNSIVLPEHCMHYMDMSPICIVLPKI